MAAEPLVTVVVVNYDSGHYLRGCLRSLAEQTYPNFEVIVVDNASGDDSLELVEEMPAATSFIRSETNLGFAAGNNLAVRRARGEWIALLNPDAEADPGWLVALMRAVHERPTFRMAASLQLSMADPTVLDGVGDCYLVFGFAWRGGHGHPVSETPPAGECFSPCGAAALYPRAAFDELGGFDERFFCYLEDVDLGFRMRLAGERCQFVPDAVVRHAGSAISDQISGFAMYHGIRNGVWTYAKNMPLPLLLLGLPVWALLTLAALGQAARLGQAGAAARGLVDGLRGVRGLRAERRRGRASLLTWDVRRRLAYATGVRPF